MSNVHLLHVWERVRTSLWFVPSLMTAAAMLLAFVTLHFDGRVTEDWLSEIGWIHSRTAAGARDLLRVVASSMITIAALTFSIIIVALQLASSQLGPRLVRKFMRDLGNQVVMGTFIGTFVYCLLVLRTIGEEGVVAPRLSVVVALILALISLGVLIYFIHHAAASIQAPNVIASVSTELGEAIDRIYPDPIGEDAPAEEPPLPPGDPAHVVCSTRSGYLQAVDKDRLMQTASDADVVVTLRLTPGQFVAAGEPLASVRPAGHVTDKVEKRVVQCCLLGSQRTPEQDVEFVLARLVEIALRALSTSHNDVFTATGCIDHLSAGLVQLAGRRIPSPLRRNAEGVVRVVACGPDLASMIERAFDEVARIRPELRAINEALLVALDRLSAAVSPTDERAHHVIERLRRLVRLNGPGAAVTRYPRNA